MTAEGRIVTVGELGPNDVFVFRATGQVEMRIDLLRRFAEHPDGVECFRDLVRVIDRVMAGEDAVLSRGPGDEPSRTRDPGEGSESEGKSEPFVGSESGR